MIRKAAVFVALALMLALGVSAMAEEEAEMIIVPHLGGSLAVSLEVVETAFYLEKDGKQRFHLVWKGNYEGKTLEGAEATDVWKKLRAGWDHEFLWVPHMGGTLGIAHDAITSIFFMEAKDGKAATLRINYGGESKALEGAEAESVWSAVSK